jgi:hypothetical protein
LVNTDRRIDQLPPSQSWSCGQCINQLINRHL